MLIEINAFDQIGNGYIQRGIYQEYPGQNGFDQQQQEVQYPAVYMQPAPYVQNNGQGYNNIRLNGVGGGYHRGHNIFNTYQKLGYGYHKPTEYNGQHPVMRFVDGGGGGGHHKLSSLPQQSVHFVGNKRIRI